MLILFMQYFSAFPCDCISKAASNTSTSGTYANVTHTVFPTTSTSNRINILGDTTPLTSNKGNRMTYDGFNIKNTGSSESPQMGSCTCGKLSNSISKNIMQTGTTSTTTAFLVVNNISREGLNAKTTINDEFTLSNAETLLSSNTRFQAISAISVAQDGIIYVADQGK